MASTQGLDSYVNRFRLRLKQLVIARGMAIVSVAAIAITAVAVTAGIRTGFPSGLMTGARLVLFGTLIALIIAYIVRPSRRIQRDGAAEIERRTPGLGGRVETFLEMHDRENPMRELLAEDTLAIAADHPPEERVRQREFNGVLSVAGAALAVLVWLAVAGPGNYAYGVRHLWAGWALPDLMPPLAIDVLPGDDGIRKGGTVRVRATMQGFEPAQAWVNARFGDDEWQQVEMSPESGEFRFTFFSVRESLQYYVSTANVRSQTFMVHVVDLPSVENLVLTYHFPEWTRREPEVHDPGGDVRAVGQTRVEVDVVSDGAMTTGALIVDEQEIELAVDGDSATAEFTVEEDGTYYVAAQVGGERIRLTDDYFITVLEDEAPEIAFLRPGRDWSASRIEEVTTRVSVSDDYALESLELKFSVSGGDWQTIELPADAETVEVDHVFFLESMSQGEAGIALAPGDLISYYAVATDRENESSTDMFFVDVQPFDRRYTQSQQMGGMPGNQQDEISRRQREIIVSTWNLIREQNESRRADEAYVADNAALLSRVQLTLKEQAQTLAQRAQARQLTADDEQIAEFVDNLNKAADAMIPAAERLAEMELEQAILPEQEALKFLLRAEAVFTDISVSMQANRGAGGGNAGRDLSEMFELEMDLEKNQYETGSNATPNQPQQELDDAAEKLEELARRQEQLAQNLERARTATPAQRWQQEMLRRELEELRERLERMRESQSSQSAQSGQGQSSEPSDQQGTPGGQPQDELRRRLESALRAMNDAEREMQEGGDPGESQRAAGEAARQLEGASDRAEEERREALQASLGDLTERAGDMHDAQSRMEDRLQEAMRDMLAGAGDDDQLDSGMTFEEEADLAERKRELQRELQSLEQDARRMAQEIRGEEPGASRQLEEAIDKLREGEVEARIAVAAAYIEQGEAIYVAGSESAVTEALRELEQDLRRTESMAGDGRDGTPQDGEGAGLQQTLAATRSLRRDLERLAQSDQPVLAPTRTGRDDLQRSTGIRVGDLEMRRDIETRIDNTSEDVIAMFRELRDAGMSVQDIDTLRRLAAEVRAAEFSGNEDILRQEAREALSLVEQLELSLADAAREGDGTVRAEPADEIPDRHKEAVAEYYRRLGETDQ